MLSAMNLSSRFCSFSLRTLMVLVGVTCIVVGFVARDWRVVAQRKAALALLDAEGFTLPDYGDAGLPPVSWLRSLMGDQPMEFIWIPTGLPNEPDLVKAASYFPEANFDISPADDGTGPRQPIGAPPVF